VCFNQELISTRKNNHFSLIADANEKKQRTPTDALFFNSVTGNYSPIASFLYPS